MKTKNRALINYYARLIKKDQYKMEGIPEDMQEKVKEVLASLPPLQPDELETSKEESK